VRPDGAGRVGSAVCMGNAVGGDGFIDEVAFFSSFGVKGDAKNDAKNDAKMMMEAGEEVVKIDEEAMEAGEETIVMASGSVSVAVARSMGDSVVAGGLVMVVTTSGGFGAMGEWEVFKKPFGLAQNDDCRGGSGCGSR
jgi:hypothetical protein